MQETSIILNTDSYKLSQFAQYPEGTEYVYSYIESRGGEYDKTVMFGLQPFLDYLAKPITQADINKASIIAAAHGVPFNYAGWMYILETHEGRIPVSIKAVPEGTVIDKKNVLLTIVNTDPKTPWITSYIEPPLLRAVWYGTTVASNSWTSKQIMLGALRKSGTASPERIAFMLNDFGSRGVSSYESSAIGGIAHLVNFAGTDNLVAIVAAMDWYDAPVSGYSIPAMEHSTVTSWGRDKEVDSYRNMLNHYAKPGAILAAVSDSYDIYNACKLWGTELKDQIIQSGATLVVRPDSGDPASVVLKCLEILEKYFGSTKNSKGYRVLNNVKVIQGDGIDHSSIRSILFTIQLAGFSSDNVNFGQGGALLQAINRDTLKFAMKCSAICVNGEWRNVQKDPITDPGKKSKTGQMKLVAFQPKRFADDGDTMVDDGPVEYRTATTNDVSQALFDALGDELVPVFENGKVLVRYTLEEIRERARALDVYEVSEDLLKAA